MYKVQSDNNADAWHNQMTATLDSFLDATHEDMLDVGIDIEDELVHIADTAPPRDNSTFVWSNDPQANDRARRKWFALVNSGRVRTDGKHYIRQGEPPYGLTVIVEIENSRAFIAILSEWTKFNMIFGSPLTGRGQLPGHRDTRWSLVKNKIDDVLADANAKLIDRHIARVEAANKQPTIKRLRR